MWLERKKFTSNTNHTVVVGTEKSLIDGITFVDAVRIIHQHESFLKTIGRNVKLRAVDDEKRRRNGVSNKAIVDEEIEKGCTIRVKLWYQS